METLSSASMKWYAISVRSRFEKKVDRGLRRRKIEIFLPLVEEVRVWSDRKKRIQLPLFPGYIFTRIDLKNRLEVLNVDGVVRFVGTAGKPSPVPEEQISWIRLLAGNPETILRERKLPVGECVRIIAGPFQGIRGIVQRIKGSTRVVITVESIGKAVSVEVMPEYVELV